jgi:hypothetical protein
MTCSKKTLILKRELPVELPAEVDVVLPNDPNAVEIGDLYRKSCGSAINCVWLDSLHQLRRSEA